MTTTACAYIPLGGEPWTKYIKDKPRHPASKEKIYFKGIGSLLPYRKNPAFQCEATLFESEYLVLEKNVDKIFERIYKSFHEKFLSEHLVVMETLVNDKIMFAKINYFESVRKNKYIYKRAVSTKNFYAEESIFYYTAYEFYEYFTCLKHTYGARCLLTCKASSRHTCRDEMLEKGKYKSVQNCLGDWTLSPVVIKYPLTLTNTYVSYNMLECIILNKCLKKNICINGTKCLVTGNNSYFCYHKIINVLNNAFPELSDIKKTQLMFKGNTITFIVNPKGIPKNQYNNFRIVVKPFYDTTVATPTVARRVRKNSKLIMRGPSFYVQSRPSDAGYDYTVSLTISYLGDIYTHDLMFNFTLIRWTNNLNISSYPYYLLSGSWIKFSVDLFPMYVVSLTIKFNRKSFPVISGQEISARIDPSLYGPLHILFQCDFNPEYNGVASQMKFRREEERYFYVQQFFNFTWHNSDKSSFTDGENLKCSAISNILFKISISQLYGYPISGNNKLSNGMPLFNLEPGVYKFGCALCLEENSSCYLKVKKFFFLRNPNYICILPYAELRGMLMKCATNSYPPLVGKFSMTLYDNRYHMVIRRTPFNTLRLPFDLNFKLNYSLICRYRFVSFQNESFPINLSVITKIFLKNVLKAEQAEISNCLEYSRFPQEISPRKNDKNKFMFFNYPFYMMTYINHTGVNLACVLFIVSMVCMIAIVVYNNWFRKPFNNEDESILNHQIEYLNRRYIVRKLNEKRMKKLFLMKTISPTASKALALRGSAFENLSDVNDPNASYVINEATEVITRSPDQLFDP